MRGKKRKKDQMEGKGLLLIAFTVTGTGVRTFLSASSTSTGKSFTGSARQYLRKVPRPHLIPVPVYPKASPYMPLP